MRGKFDTTHWERDAYVYVRQSTMAQMIEHTESAKVIQGKSGESARGQGGFGYLVGAVVKGEAGAILVLEVSRLSRWSEDWRLLGLYSVAGVAVIDEQGIYVPSDADDKLLLDLKGTMSEAEPHWLGLRRLSPETTRRLAMWIAARRGKHSMSAARGEKLAAKIDLEEKKSQDGRRGRRFGRDDSAASVVEQAGASHRRRGNGRSGGRR